MQKRLTRTGARIKQKKSSALTRPREISHSGNKRSSPPTRPTAHADPEEKPARAFASGQTTAEGRGGKLYSCAHESTLSTCQVYSCAHEATPSTIKEVIICYYESRWCVRGVDVYGGLP